MLQERQASHFDRGNSQVEQILPIKSMIVFTSWGGRFQFSVEKRTASVFDLRSIHLSRYCLTAFAPACAPYGAEDPFFCPSAVPSIIIPICLGTFNGICCLCITASKRSRKLYLHDLLFFCSGYSVNILTELVGQILYPVLIVLHGILWHLVILLFDFHLSLASRRIDLIATLDSRPSSISACTALFCALPSGVGI